jgi:hypothetical protein
MPKDRERYRYVDVGLERGSWILAMFEEDAKKHQMSDQPGKLMALRLTEFYELKQEQGTSFSREMPPVRNGQPALQPASDRGMSKNTRQAQGDSILEISQQETENADEAANYWANK